MFSEFSVSTMSFHKPQQLSLTFSMIDVSLRNKLKSIHQFQFRKHEVFSQIGRIYFVCHAIS